MQHVKQHATVIMWFQQDIIRCYCFYYDVHNTSLGLNSAALHNTHLLSSALSLGLQATSAGSLPITRGGQKLRLALSRGTKLFCVCMHVGERVGGRKANRISENWWRSKASVVLVLGSNLRNSRLVRDTCSLPHPQHPVTLIQKI